MPTGAMGRKGTPSLVTVAGISLTNLSLDEAAHHVCDLARGRKRADTHLVNAYTVSLVDTQPEVCDVITRSTLNFADGKPLTWAARLLRRSRLHQVRGPDLFERVLELGDSYGVRHFLLGGSEETLSSLQLAIRNRHPNAEVVGALSPPFRLMTDSEVQDQDAQIGSSDANIVWVGLGTPKQDFEAARLAAKLSITTVAVGAAFDFSAGRVRRAPNWMSRMGLEWLFRFAVEPRRLWRRYTVGNVRFLAAVVRSSSAGRPRT